eukprot:TRINITY_DN34967_c0_g1_i1.p1 TRINITY_DN34967_c0_g1~~TRINITY_DN34967_c0_g1_i1.p1  ORF type:complete len:274 (-),score=19.47 TRINITY_DN34967_c0_g1_i1:165-986(-)
MGKMKSKSRALALTAVTEEDEVLLMRDRNNADVITKKVNSTVLHIMTEQAQVRLMTTDGYASFAFRSNSTMRRLPCSRDNRTVALRAAAQDTKQGTYFYALSEEAEMVTLLLPGEKRVTSCRWRGRHTVPGVDGAASFAAVDGAILAVTAREILAFNVTKGSRRPTVILREDIAMLSRYFGVDDMYTRSNAPLLSVMASGPLLMQTSNNVIALYTRLTSDQTASGGLFNWFNWSRPVLILAIIAGRFIIPWKRLMGQPALYIQTCKFLLWLES